MGIWTFWLVLAVGLLIAELFTLSLTCLYVGLGAACGMFACLLGGGWIASTLTFLIATTILYLSTIKLRHNIVNRLHRDQQTVATGMDALCGRTGVVEVTDRPRIRIDGDIWQVENSDPDSPLHTGDKVKVISYESNTLKVKPL